MLKSQSGFTLIEVVAAFVVFALLFTSILQIMQQSLRGAQRTVDYTQMTLWAQSKLDSVGLEEPLTSGVYTGIFRHPGHGQHNRQGGRQQEYRWELTVSPFAIDDLDSLNHSNLPAEKPPAIDVWHLQLTVSSPQNRRQARFATLRSAMAQP